MKDGENKNEMRRGEKKRTRSVNGKDWIESEHGGMEMALIHFAILIETQPKKFNNSAVDRGKGRRREGLERR